MRRPIVRRPVPVEECVPEHNLGGDAMAAAGPPAPGDDDPRRLSGGPPTMEDVAAEVLKLRLVQQQHQELKQQYSRAQSQLKRLPPHSVTQLQHHLEQNLKNNGAVQEALLMLIQSLCVVCRIEFSGDLISVRRLLQDPHTFTTRLCSVTPQTFQMRETDDSSGLALFLAACSKFEPVRERHVNECYQVLRAWLQAFWLFSQVAAEVAPTAERLIRQENLLRRLSGRAETAPRARGANAIRPGPGAVSAGISYPKGRATSAAPSGRRPGTSPGLIPAASSASSAIYRSRNTTSAGSAIASARRAPSSNSPPPPSSRSMGAAPVQSSVSRMTGSRSTQGLTRARSERSLPQQPQQEERSLQRAQSEKSLGRSPSAGQIGSRSLSPEAAAMMGTKWSRSPSPESAAANATSGRAVGTRSGLQMPSRSPPPGGRLGVDVRRPDTGALPRRSPEIPRRGVGLGASRVQGARPVGVPSTWSRVNESTRVRGGAQPGGYRSGRTQLSGSGVSFGASPGERNCIEPSPRTDRTDEDSEGNGGEGPSRRRLKPKQYEALYRSAAQVVAGVGANGVRPVPQPVVSGAGDVGWSSDSSDSSDTDHGAHADCAAEDWWDIHSGGGSARQPTAAQTGLNAALTPSAPPPPRPAGDPGAVAVRSLAASRSAPSLAQVVPPASRTAGKLRASAQTTVPRTAAAAHRYGPTTQTAGRYPGLHR